MKGNTLITFQLLSFHSFLNMFFYNISRPSSVPIGKPLSLETSFGTASRAKVAGHASRILCKQCYLNTCLLHKDNILESHPAVMSHNHIPSMNKQWDNSETKHRQIERAQPDITCMSLSEPSSQCLYTNSERNVSKVITITFIAVCNPAAWESWNLTMTTKRLKVSNVTGQQDKCWDTRFVIWGPTKAKTNASAS